MPSKALSIKQPWASLIAYGVKDIENRTWKTKFRGKIYIHASGKLAGDPKKILTDEQWKDWHSKVFMRQLNFSAIIGEVDIMDCVINHPSIWADKKEISERPFACWETIERYLEQIGCFENEK